MSSATLETAVQFVRGVGPERARLLANLNLHTVEDLLLNLPRHVLDFSDVRSVDELEDGVLQTVAGRVVDVDVRRLSHGRTLSAVLLECVGGHVRGLWFNQKWVLKAFQPNAHVLFSGKPKRRDGRWEFSHPQTKWLEEDVAQPHGGVLACYGLTDGLKMHEMRRIMRETVEQFASTVPEKLPAAFLEAHGLPPIGQALSQLHLPQSMDEYNAGRRRIVFDDLFEFQLALALRRRYWKQHDQAAQMPTTAKIDARIRRLFPFSFTDGQDQAVREISQDLASGCAMHRLLQADVGAGKTAVALYAMLVAIAAGYQAVLMAPTEVLATQHWATIEQTLSQSRVERLLLRGQLSARERERALNDVREGQAQLIVGTQAIIQKDVEFSKLGLVVIDEQHKFGVEQRARFTSGAMSPHVLVMTATPIPRSLCLTQFGDLDITTISELPPGRQRVVTSRVVGAGARNRAWGFLRKQLRAGRQAYVICPRVESTTSSPATDSDEMATDDLEAAFDSAETESVPLASAVDVFEELSAGELGDFRVGLVHGQMDRGQKTQSMEAFDSGEIQVLVSTTVVEVGIDVPNATLMVVLQAERFGLSQLHQLRGRIARGSFQGYCFLFSDTDSAEGNRRLHALESTSDGFKIAEVDFEIRGPGDVLGTKQHGQLPLKVAHVIRDREVLDEARSIGFELVHSGMFDEPQFAPLKVHVLERFGRLMNLSQSG